MRTSRFAMAVLALALACGGGDAPSGTTGTGGTSGTTGTTGTTGGTGSTTNQIVVNDGSFTPPSTTVTPGTTVTWTWQGSAAHNVTFSNSAIGSSSTQTTGTFSRSFPNAGTFNYSCTLHGGMDGTIVVQ